MNKLNPNIHGYLTVALKRADEDFWNYLCYNKHNLLTNGGRDFIHNQAYTNTSAGTEGSRYIGVSNNATAPAAGDTTLAGELTTNGFARAAATTNTHGAGTNTTTLGITFTAAGTVADIQKSALFNASTNGTMTHENTFTAVSVISGDTLQVTWTLTLG